MVITCVVKYKLVEISVFYMLLKFIELLSCGGGAVSVVSPLSSCGIEQSGSSSDSYSEVVGSNPTPAILSNRINIIIRMCKIW